MHIGLLADTHDRSDAMDAAIKTLRANGAKYFIHCGDVGGEHILDALAGLPAAFVWGNNDFDRIGLQRYAESLGITALGAFGELTFDDKRIAVMHGDDSALMRRTLAAQTFDYLFHGHTHVRADWREGRTRIINPGALHRARPKSVAVLDTLSDRLLCLEIAI